MPGKTRPIPFFGLALALAIALAATPCALEAQTKLLRFPDLHGNQVVFTYAGDLWLAPATGGTARQLTTHPGLELFGKFSPDGSWIAFTGQYDGDEQVYVVPVTGGAPRQLTWYPANGPLPPRWGYDNQVYGWTPDGGSVLFRSMRDGWDLSDTKLYTVALDGGLPEMLPMPDAGGGALSPDGGQVVYSPLTRDFRHWKRYQGGWAQDLFIFDLETHASTKITDDPRTDRDPMWIGDTIYYASDRDGKLNLYAYDVASGRTEQVTREEVWDVRWPSAGTEGRIVYELSGELRILDTANGRSRALEIHVPTDGLAMRPSRVDAAPTIEDFHLGPEGKRAVFSARGDVFTVPLENGPTRNLTRTSGAHDRKVAWSPDGTTIAYVSDASGEEEIWLVPQDGRGDAEQITGLPDSSATTGRKLQLLWSPDGERIAYRDQAGKLYVVELEAKEATQIADDIVPFGLDYAWSPDGEHLAIALADPSGFRSIHLWSVGDAEPRRVTGDTFNEFSPSWDPAGDYLFYLSDRMFQPQIGSIEFNYVVDRETYVYAMALRDDVAHPFPPRSDEVSAEAGSDASDGDEADDEPSAEASGSEPVRIDFEGLADRVARVPIEADNYFGVVALEGSLLIVKGSAFYYGRQGRPVELLVYSLEDREATELASGIQGLAVSPDGSKVMIQANGGYKILDATAAGKDSAKAVSTAGLRVDRVPAEEWAQIFDEVWRRFRDYFYVTNMHGYDWEALREQYASLLEYVAHRSDLNYVLAEMISELSTSHSYITNGDFDVPERPRAALLGARFELDEGAGRFRVTEIFQGQNEEDGYRSPLTEIGVGLSVGDYLLAVNGLELTADGNPYRLLRNAGGAPVEITFGATPDLESARTVLVDAIADEDALLYLAFTERNRAYVAERSDGRIGYLHLPDMGVAGIREWIKWFYPQIRKEGLVIDVRSNGGGNVSPMLIERLRRELLATDFERNQDTADTVPGVVFTGHLVCLLDEDTASDGDQFAWAFREAGLGPLVGKRSWGGVVGIYPGRDPLIDGGLVMVPEAGSAGADGQWVIEGHGVDPDYEVDNDPAELIDGRDQQLEKAVDLLLEKIEEEPRPLPTRPEPPLKTDA